MNPILELIIKQSPALIGLIGELWHKQNPAIPAPSSVEIIAAFEQAFKDSAARDAFLITALQAEIDARQVKPA